MTTRRQVLKTTATALTLSSIGHGVFGFADEKAAGLPFYKILYEDRAGDSLAFAASVRGLGGSVYGVHGELHELWATDLNPVWQRGPAAIAGLTTEPDAFTLEILGREAGLAPVFRGVHVFRDAQTVRHEISGPAAAVAAAQAALNSQIGWTAAIASALAAIDAADESTRQFTARTAVEGRTGPRLERLISWALAPNPQLPRISRSA